MENDNFELIAGNLASRGQGEILSIVLKSLSQEDIQRLKQKAAEGALALEMDKLTKVNQFHVSSADISSFISTVRELEVAHNRPGSTYTASGSFKTASGTTTIQSKKGCYIATQVYCGEWHPNVIFLKSFRDSFLLKNTYGESFVRCYYAVSPKLSKTFLCRGFFGAAIRVLLDWICVLLRKLVGAS